MERPAMQHPLLEKLTSARCVPATLNRDTASDDFLGQSRAISIRSAPRAPHPRLSGISCISRQHFLISSPSVHCFYLCFRLTITALICYLVSRFVPCHGASS